MNPDEIKHFLVSFDPSSGKTDVQPFDTDYDGAIAAYSKAERANRGGNLDIVLLGADSLETIKKTHSSYFNGGLVRLEDLLPG